jgi:hypothetical protein
MTLKTPSRVGTFVALGHQTPVPSKNQSSAAQSTAQGSRRRLYCRFCFALPAHRAAPGSRSCARCQVAGAFALVEVEA